jgi:fused signal recognition particle receptor
LGNPDFKVLMCAADTYRAGAVAQLQVWAERAGADIVGPADVLLGLGREATAEACAAVKPGTVVYKALDRAEEGGYDVLLVDTSGRLSTNTGLTKELAKIYDIIEKRLGGPPLETTLVLDASQGSSAVTSSATWGKSLPITSLALTKLDGSSAGGSCVGVAASCGIPVAFVGVGEGVDDLREFDAGVFVDSLLDVREAERAEVNARVEVLRTALLAEREKEEEEAREAASNDL